VRRRHCGRARGFTLVEVLVALMIIAMGLAALMVAVSGTARTSGYLRDKTLAQWIALNRISEVRLNLNKFGQNTDTGELVFAGRTWHYDTRYFDTTFPSMKRLVVRVYAGNAKTKGSPMAETTSFIGTTLAVPGSSNMDWALIASPGAGASASVTPTTTPGSATTPSTTPTTPPPTTSTPGTNGQAPVQ
jgi:general secretion pathway protein I